MKLTPDMRAKLTYHARMFALAASAGIAIFVTLIFVFYALLALGAIHPEFR